MSSTNKDDDGGTQRRACLLSNTMNRSTVACMPTTCFGGT